MESYPVNVLLALLASFITLFLGFLPSQHLPRTFFQKHVGVAGVMWLAVGILMPPTLYFTGGAALLCVIAWYFWGNQSILQAKVWQSAATAVGVTLGVITVLRMSPQAVPDDMPLAAQGWFLAGPYMVGLVLGTGYALAAMSWQYSAVETNELAAGEERGLLRTLLAWNLLALSAQAIFVISALLFLPQLYPSFGVNLVERLISFSPPMGEGWYFVGRMICGFFIPFATAAWLWNHLRDSPMSRWFWAPLIAFFFLVLGQLLALQIHL